MMMLDKNVVDLKFQRITISFIIITIKQDYDAPKVFKIIYKSQD